MNKQGDFRFAVSVPGVEWLVESIPHRRKWAEVGMSLAYWRNREEVISLELNEQVVGETVLGSVGSDPSFIQ